MVWAVNESGQAAGASGSCSAFNPILGNYLQPLHALLWDNGTAIDLGNLGGTGHGFGIIAKNLNNQGQVVGVSDLPGDHGFHAFIWSKATGMKDLGVLPGNVGSASLAIDDRGVVTGVSVDATFTPTAFIWQDGVMSDLNSLVPGGSPLHLATACSINSRGEIIGFAFSSTGDVHGYLLTPK
jgi:probable HAF family extracellular repeat protein